MYKNISLILYFFTIILLHASACMAIDYILYVRAGGNLGSELHTYWHTVKNDPDISHDAIRNYPPHCSLTGFFPKEYSKDIYIRSVENAIQQVNNTPSIITIDGLIQGNQKSKLDYIKLSSSYLFAVTQAFMNYAQVPQKYLKNPQNFTYHITLRDHVFKHDVKKKLNKIQNLERQIDLSVSTTWSLFLYERDDNGDLSIIKEFPLQTNLI